MVLYIIVEIDMSLEILCSILHPFFNDTYYPSLQLIWIPLSHPSNLI
jgi:hypothetical protein